MVGHCFQGTGHSDSDIELCIDDVDSIRSGPRAIASTQPGFQRVSLDISFFTDHLFCSSFLLVKKSVIFFLVFFSVFENLCLLS